MANKIKKLHIAGALFTVIAGSLLHFVYEWSDKNPVAAVFSAVNESTWEHLKLLFWPAIFFGLLEWALYGMHRCSFIYAKSISLLLGLFTIISSFYTYTGILGKNYLLLDIGTFIAGTAVSYWYSYKKLTSDAAHSTAAQAAGIILWVLLVAGFLLFTFFTPHIGLFLDPVTGGYGL